MFEVAMASRSDVGGRSHNEDHLQHGSFPEGWYAVLSDGAGGHSNGAIASDLVVRLASTVLGSQAAQSELAPESLGNIILDANDALNLQQQGLRGRQRMHATLVLLWIDRRRQEALWAHVGDSRLYWLRQGRVEHVTRDDSVVQSMVDAGLLGAEQAREHPLRNQLIAALGADDALLPHVCDAAVPLREGDAFLLCSDGWYDRLDAGDIERALLGALDVGAWLDTMRQLVEARQRPNQDNFSAVAVWIGNPAEITRIQPP
jgi:serine/threonine protein phosphatase PrpC